MNDNKIKLKISQFYPKKQVFHYINHNYFGDDNNNTIIANNFSKIVGYYPNIKQPQTFNEKLLWLSQHYNNPLTTLCSDRYLVKEYVKEQLGQDICIPTIKKYDSIYDIDLNELPEQFVLKTNWNIDENQTITVKKKQDITIDEIRANLDNWLQPWNNLYYNNYNLSYKDIKPVMYAEQYIEKTKAQFNNYKIYCFNGKADFVLVEQNCRTKKYKRYFYDRDFNETEFKIGSTTKTSLKAKSPNFDKMIEYADKLSKPFPFVCISFYEIDGKIYFNEFIFDSSAGFKKINPLDWDKKLGDKIKLPEVS